jgi:hypothetical protein
MTLFAKPLANSGQHFKLARGQAALRGVVGDWLRDLRCQATASG